MDLKREKVQLLPIDQIHPNPAQPRTEFDLQALQGLAESIYTCGLLQPITVRRRPDRSYELVAGERRLRACRLLGHRTIRAIVTELDDRQSAVLALVENLQRADLSPFEQARGISELIGRYGLTQEEAALRLGMAQSTVANKLRLLKLPKQVQQVVITRGLTERHARALLKLPPQQQYDAACAMAAQEMNVAAAERYVESLLKGEKTPTPARRPLVVVKDLRIFRNTIEHAIDVMKQAGIEAVAECQEHGDCIEYTVRIPKSAAYRPRAGHEKDTTLFKVSV